VIACDRKSKTLLLINADDTDLKMQIFYRGLTRMSADQERQELPLISTDDTDL
jgi:hypothetical protein